MDHPPNHSYDIPIMLCITLGGACLIFWRWKQGDSIRWVAIMWETDDIHDVRIVDHEEHKNNIWQHM